MQSQTTVNAVLCNLCINSLRPSDAYMRHGMLLIGPLGINFSEILIGIQTFSFKKMHLKMSSGKWRPFCPGLNVLIQVFRHLSQRKYETITPRKRAPLIEYKNMLIEWFTVSSTTMKNERNPTKR